MPDFGSKSEKKDLQQQKEPNSFLKEKLSLNSNTQPSPLETDRCNINPTGQQIEKTQQAATPVILNEVSSPIKSSTESDLKIQRALQSALQKVFGSPQIPWIVNAKDQVLKKFSKDQIVNNILSNHVKHYGTWIN